MNKPTQRDIADSLGVTAATVSLAMNDSPRISARTKQRVEEALSEFGYVYSRSAAGLRTSKTLTVGLVLNNVSDPFFSSLLASLEEALAETGRTVFLCNANESAKRQAAAIRKMSEYNVDGIIVSPAIGSRPEDFADPRIPLPPTVFVSRSLAGTGIDHVVADDFEAARLATARLLDLGHRRVAVIGGAPGVTCFRERMRGHRAALEQASLGFDEALVRPCVPTLRGGFEAAAWVTGRDPRPTAAISYNGLTTLGLFHGLPRGGLRPGRNFALIGNEDIEEAGLVTPSLSMTTIPSEDMGRRAAHALVERIRDPSAPQRRIVLGTELITRESCGAVVPPEA